MLCGLLRSSGIKCEQLGVRSVDEFGGPYEILVATDDLADARALLATVAT